MILFFIVGFNIKNRKCFVVATVLEIPRFKTKFLSDENKAKQWIIDELLAIIQSPKIIKTIHSHNENLQKQDIISKTHDDIWKCFDDIVNNSKSDDSSFEDSSSKTSFER